MTTALIVIDTQVSLIDEGAWDAGGVLGRIGGLLAGARAAGAPVLFVTDRRVEPDGSIHPSLEVREGDAVVSKSYCDSFLDTELHDLLRAKGASRLVVAGLATDFCIDTSVRRALSLGYDVVLVADGHTTNDQPDLKASQIVAHFNRVLDGLEGPGARVRVVPASEVAFLSS